MVAFVTGGSRGIGAAIVRLFTQKGFKVAFTYTKSEREAKALSEETGASLYLCDSSDRNTVFRTVEEVGKELGSVDILVNNAGISQISLCTDMTEEEWNRMVGVNLSGCFYTSQAVLPGMIHQKKGKIINISSMWGVVGASCEVAYSATKAGVIGLTKALAKEVGPSGITVNCIAPGVIDTEMNRHLSPEDMQELVEATPLSRLGTPEDVAKLVLFLAGDGGDFVTGQVILQDGGFANS